MAVAAEADAACIGVNVTLIAYRPVVTMPAPPAVKARHTRGMEAGVSPPDTVEIVMTTGPSAGRITRIVTGGTVLGIATCRPTVLVLPTSCRMTERNAEIPFMAINTKRAIVMAARAVDSVATCIQTVGENVVPVVSITLDVVTLVARLAVNLLVMA